MVLAPPNAPAVTPRPFRRPRSVSGQVNATLLLLFVIVTSRVPVDVPYITYVPLLTTVTGGDTCNHPTGHSLCAHLLACHVTASFGLKEEAYGPFFLYVTLTTLLLVHHVMPLGLSTSPPALA